MSVWLNWLVMDVIHRDHYITMVRWRDNSHLLVAWSNRAQNHTVLTLCNAYSTDCQTVRFNHSLIDRCDFIPVHSTTL